MGLPLRLFWWPVAKDDQAPRTPGRSKADLTALGIALAGLTLSFLAYYPGAMSWDSFVMWGMGWEWPWHDWHSRSCSSSCC